MYKKLVKGFVFALLFSVLVSCSGGSYKISNGELESTEYTISGDYEGYSGHYFKTVKLKEGENLTVTFSEHTETGEIIAKVLDSNGELVGTLGTEEPLKINSPGKYTLQVEGKNHRGNFTLNWEID